MDPVEKVLFKKVRELVLENINQEATVAMVVDTTNAILKMLEKPYQYKDKAREIAYASYKLVPKEEIREEEHSFIDEDDEYETDEKFDIRDWEGDENPEVEGEGEEDCGCGADTIPDLDFDEEGDLKIDMTEEDVHKMSKDTEFRSFLKSVLGEELGNFDFFGPKKKAKKS